MTLAVGGEAHSRPAATVTFHIGYNGASAHCRPSGISLVFSHGGVNILRYKAYLAATAVYFAAPAWAAEAPTYAPPATWVNENKAPLSGGSDARPWLRADQQVLIEGDKQSTFVDNAFHIQTAEILRNWTDLSFEWQPDRDDLIVHNIEIIRDGKTIDQLALGLKLKILQREKDFEQRAIDGRLTATAPIEDLRVGDTVRFSTTLVERTSVLNGNGEALIDLPADPAPIAAGSVRILWPKDLPVRWKTFGKGFAATESDKAGYRILTQSYPLPKQDEMPQDAPLRFRRTPGVELTTFASWTDLSRTIAPVYATKGLIKEGGALAAQIDRIAAASSDPKVRANAALRFVQNEVRYLYRGMDNGNYVPEAPETTWSLRYGDCKAKTLLLLTMLERLGIEARPALVHSTFGDLLRDRLPTLAAFDHVVVEAKVDGTDYWLDGTTAGTHIEDLADVPPFRFALPITIEGHDIAALPERRPARPQMSVAIEYDQSAGTAFPPLFDLTFTLRGAAATPLETFKAQAKPDQLRAFTQNTLGAFINNGAIYSRSIEIDEKSGLATIRAKGIGNLQWNRSEEQPYLAITGLIGDFKVDIDRARAAWRDIPVSTGDSMTMEYRWGLTLPNEAAFKIDGEAKIDRDIAGFVLKRDARLSGTRVENLETLWSKGVELPANGLPAARAQVATIKKSELRVRAPAAYPSRVEEIASARKGKRLSKLLAAYQLAIDDDPDEANNYLNRAAFNSGIFDYKAAIIDYDAAIERAPTANTYQYRAWAKGMLGNYAPALADIEEALSLDPGSAEALAQKVAILTELGRTDEAIALADEQMALVKDKREWIGLKSDALGRAGRAEEGATTIAEALAERPGDPSLLNDLCWLRGTREIQLDVALKDCTRAIELSENAAMMLDSRAMVYFRLGQTEEARADLEAALKLSPGEAGSLYMRGIIRARSNDPSGAAGDLALARLQNGEIDKTYARYGIKP
jgi:tetratricopeptide (TPR) repeat protein